MFISGNVYGVGFRLSCKQEVDRLGIAGWVRNLSDGRVELVAEGSKHAVEKMLAWTQTESPGVVEHVEVQEEKEERLTGFKIK